MTARSFRGLFLILVLFAPCWAQTGYLKLNRDGRGAPDKLQTAVVSFRGPNGQTVDLISVIHVGEKSYYHRLNQFFKKYDGVLYEMVLDVPKRVAHQNQVRQLLGRDKREPKIDTGKAGKDAVSVLQRKLAEVLELSHQLTVIDYGAENFRHADLTLEEFEEAMKAKERSPLDILKDLLAGDDEQGPPEYRELSKLPLLKIWAQGPDDEERAVLKTGLAAYFAQTKDISNEIQGEVLIALRNERALEVLQQRLQRKDRKLAIFYGAAHMPHFARRLREMGYVPISKSWIQAWDL